MKTINYTCSSFILLLLSFSLDNALAGGGGGTIEIIEVIASPYSAVANVNKELVVERKKESDKRRVIKPADFPGSPDVLDRCPSIGLWYTNNITRAKFELVGWDSKAGKLQKIPFSEIESIEIQELYEYGYMIEALLKVIVFPAISIDDLLNKKPDYTTLKNDYTKEIVIKTIIRDPTFGDLYLVCNEDDNYQITEIENFTYLNKGQKIQFTYRLEPNAPVWWAIEEVIKDKSYPYKKSSYGSLLSIEPN
jgi:hypothetical protein